MAVRKRITPKLLAFVFAILLGTMLAILSDAAVAQAVTAVSPGDLNESDPNEPISARKAYDNFLEMFYYEEFNGLGRVRNRKSAGRYNDFWKSAEMFETMVDAYERFGDQKYEDVMSRYFDGFIDMKGRNWAGNSYNDDIMWMVIGSARAYLLTGEEKYLDVALENFSLCYNRSADDTLGGGIWWTTDKGQKNACVNGPGAIAACLLAESTGLTEYYDKAIFMIDWVSDHLIGDDGAVLDNMDKDGKVTGWKFTYNQGTFIGANTMLYEYTGDVKYLERAKKAAAYTAAKMGDEIKGNVMSRESSKGDADSLAFKGILGRWLGYLARETGITAYDSWMQDNALSTWRKRNSDGLMWTDFTEQTAENIQEYQAKTIINDKGQEELEKIDGIRNHTAWGCSAAVAWILNASAETVRTIPDPDMFTVEAEAGLLSGSAVPSYSEECSGGQFVVNMGGAENGTVILTMSSDSARTIAMRIYYVADDSGYMQVSANGTKATVSCKGSNETKTNAAPAIVEVKLEVGVNTIVLGGINGADAPNIDYVQFYLTGSEAQKTVINLIDRLPDADAVTVNDELRANAVYAAYDSLPDKTTVTNVSKLNEVIQAIAKLGSGEDSSKEMEEAILALQNVIIEVNGLTEEDYTADSWAALRTALTAAHTAVINVNATKEQLESARIALADARNALVPVKPPAEPLTPPVEPLTPPIVQKEISKLSISSMKAQTHTGCVLKPSVTIKDGSKVLKQDVDYSVFYKNNKYPGIAQLTITGRGSYKGSVTKSFVIVAKKGRTYIVGNYKFKVLNASIRSGTVSLTKPVKNTLKTVKVLDTVKVGNYKYKVTEIGKYAFKGNKKLKTVTIGKNVKKIGTGAFYNDKELKKITIYSKVIKSVGKNALKGIYGKAVIMVPRSKLKSYKSKFMKKGQKSSTLLS